MIVTTELWGNKDHHINDGLLKRRLTVNDT